MDGLSQRYIPYLGNTISRANSHPHIHRPYDYYDSIIFKLMGKDK